MSYKIFLIDSNSLITPYKNYYPFDFAPGFWLQIEQSIKYGEIAILDIVKRLALVKKKTSMTPCTNSSRKLMLRGSRGILFMMMVRAIKRKFLWS